MSALCNYLAACFVASLTASAQEAAGPMGFLRFVNATGFEGRIRFTLDGEEINPDGYRSGQATGPIGYSAKSYAVKLVHDQLGEDEVSFVLEPGEIKAVIALPKVEKPREDEPPVIRLTHFVLTSQPTGGGGKPSLTLLQASVLPELAITVAGQPVTLSRLSPETMPVPATMGEFPEIAFRGQKLCTLNFKDKDDTVLILFPDAQGSLRHLSFLNTAR